MEKVMENKEVAKGKKNKKEMSEESKKVFYDKTKSIMESTRCIEQYELYTYIYKLIIRRLRKLDGYLDSNELLEEYEARLEKHQIEGKEKIYQHLLELKNQVQRAEDIQWVRKEAKRIPDYKDVEEINAWCDDVVCTMEKKEQIASFIRLGIILVILVVIVIFTKLYFF